MSCPDPTRGRNVLDPTIEIILYNTHLFGRNGQGRLTDFFANKINIIPPVVHDDERRADQIGRRLVRSGAPIIGLCEVWDDALAHELTVRLRVTHPHAFRPPVRRHPLLYAGSGLLLLSRYPMHDAHFVPYRKLVAADRFSRKGILRATLDPGFANGLKLVVFLTHTQAEKSRSALVARRSNLEQLRGEVERACAEIPGAVPLVLGDLNVNAEDRLGRVSNEFADVVTPLLGGATPMSDLFRTANPDPVAEPGHTWDGRQNRLAHVFHPKEIHRQRLDFAFAGRRATPVSSTVLKDFADTDSGMDLSDHYPLQASIIL